MTRLQTVHEFVDTCHQKCLVHKDRCLRYHTVREYIATMETRFERRKDVLACEKERRSFRV
jgi:hypothetical protein